MNTKFWTVISLTILIIQTAICHGQQMRIETEVFVGQQPALVSKSLTLFDGPFVYDFLFTNDSESTKGGSFSLEEIVVFDRVGQSITLLDQQRHKKLVLSHTDLLSMSAAMKASESLRKKDVFLLEPKFDEEVNDSEHELALTSKRMSYKCQCESIEDPKAMLSYFHFADWAARLNVSDSRKMPPFARLKLNDALRKKGWVPTQVNLQLEMQTGQSLVATAKHHRLDQLSENDQIRIRQAKTQMSDFDQTSLVEYRNLNPVSSK